MTEVLNKKNKQLVEILDIANKSDDPISTLKQYMSEDNRIGTMLGYAVNPNFKMNLPHGLPPFNASDVPLGLAEIELLNLCNRMYVLYNDSTKIQKESVFIQWLEQMHVDEANLLCAIKDQEIHSIFPKLTLDVFVEAFGWDKEMFARLVAKAKGNV